MNKSDDIGELASALSKLQGEIKDAIKDTTAHKYKYADLSQVLEISRPLLSKNGLSVSQLPGAAHDKITVDTILMHESGQWISSTIEMAAIPANGMNAAQAIGAVITYARRYALAAIVGITQTDTDAVADKVDNKNRQNKVDKLNIHQVNELRGLIKITDTEEAVFINAMKSLGMNTAGEIKLENFYADCYGAMKSRLMLKKDKMEKKGDQQTDEREINM